jgi:leader peptidase (prepilin peptidase)/N-methyltransferase
MTHLSSIERLTGGSWPELAGLAALALVLAGVSVMAAPDLPGWFGAGLAVVVVMIAAIDARHFVIPNELTALGLALGLWHSVVTSPDRLVDGLIYSCIRAAVMALLFLALREVYRRVRGRDGIGLGDVKLAAVMGAWLGWMTIPIAIEIAALSALAVYGVRRFAKGQPFDVAAKFPFGLFLAPSIWLCWLLEVVMYGPG